MKVYNTWMDAREYAVEQANKLNLDIAIRGVKEYGKNKFVVKVACVNDSDYARAEIVHPGDMI